MAIERSIFQVSTGMFVGVCGTEPGVVENRVNRRSPIAGADRSSAIACVEPLPGFGAAVAARSPPTRHARPVFDLDEVALVWAAVTVISLALAVFLCLRAPLVD